MSYYQVGIISTFIFLIITSKEWYEILKTNIVYQKFNFFNKILIITLNISIAVIFWPLYMSIYFYRCFQKGKK